MGRDSQTARLFALGDYQRAAETGGPEEWRTHAAMGLMGKTAAALAGLERFDHEEARFYAAVARWIDGQDAEAERLLASVPTPHARNLLRLIRLPRIGVLAQLWETKEGYWGLVEGSSTDARFRVRNVENSPYLNVHRLYDRREPPHFYISAQAEWHLIPPNIRELPCPIFAQTGDPDIHVQVVYPWLRLFDEVVTTSFDEWEDARLLSGVPTSVFPKLFSIRLPQPHLDPYARRIHQVTLTGAWFHPYQPEKARLVHQIARIPGVQLVLYDGYLDRASYHRLLAASKVVVCFSRYTGCLPSRGLESLSLGCATLIPRGNVWSHFVGEAEGVFPYDPGGTDLPDVIQRILEAWPEMLPRLRRGSALVRREFCRPRVASQYLRYLTFLAAKPRPPRPPLTGDEPRQKRLVFWRGGFPGGPELRERLRNESLERWSATREVRSARLFIDITRELALLAAEMAEQSALHRPGPAAGPSALLAGVFRFSRMGMDRFPRCLVLRFNVIRVALHLGRPQDVTTALALCRQTVQEPPDVWEVDVLDDVFPYDFFSHFFNYRAYLDLATAHLKNGTAVKGDLVRLILASLHNYLGLYLGAPTHLATAVRLDPEFPRYQLNLAMALLGRGEAGDRQVAKRLLIELAETSWLFHEAYALLTEHFGEELATSPVLAGIADAGLALMDAVSLTSRAHPFDVWGATPLQPPARDGATAGLPRPRVTPDPAPGGPDPPTGPTPTFPLVSALVTVYQGERFMRGLLEDLLRQTIADRLEIVIVDSGSPQNERAIVEDFQRRYENIVYIRTEERENSHAALNRAIRAARGKYLTLANADDRHHPDAFRAMARVLDARPEVALVYADSAITDQENATLETARIIGHLRLPEFDRRLLFRGCFLGPQPMWRRALHDRHGVFDPEFQIAGDYELWLRLARTETFAHIPEVLGLYLLSRGSNERVNRLRRHLETERARARHWPAEWGELPPWDADYNVMREAEGNADGASRAGEHDAAQPRSVPIHPDLKAGQRALENQAWAEACQAFLRVLERDGNCAPARSGLGLGLIALGDGEEGLAQLQEGVRLEPAPDLVNNLACGLIHLGRVEEAARLLQGILELVPGHAAARANLERLEAARGNGDGTDRPGTDLAIGARRPDRTRGSGQAALARLLETAAQFLAARRWAEAVDAFRSALLAAPDLAEAREALGSALLVLGRTKEAIVELQAAAERRKTSGAWNSLGWACAISQRMEEARDAFVKAIESDPTDLEPQRNLAALFEFLGMAVEAEATYDLILLSVPGDLEATQGKARCQARDTKGEGEIPSMVGARG